MSNTKYTEPPWCVEGNLVRSSIDAVAEVFGSNTEEKRANAKLIAAAPDMFSIIRKLADWNELPESIQEDIQSVIVKVQSSH